MGEFPERTVSSKGSGDMEVKEDQAWVKSE